MIDLNNLSEAAATASGFVKLQNDEDKVAFFIPTSSVLRERYTVWTGVGSTDVEKGTEGAKKKLLADVAVVAENGKPLAVPELKVFEAATGTWDRIAKATQKAGGDVKDHVYEVERIGAKGDKKTAYRVKVIGKAADYQVPAGGAAAAPQTPPDDPKSQLMALIAEQGLKPAVVAATIQSVVPGKSLPGALTTDEAAKVVAALRG